MVTPGRTEAGPSLKLPERPDASLPLLRAAWDRMFRGLPTIALDRPVFRQETVPARMLPRALMPALRTRVLPSQNWSGASIVPQGDMRPGGRQLALLFGRWRVPTLALPPFADQRVGAGRYACSTWIGFDGARRYWDSSLPQIGLEHWLTVAADGSIVQSGDVFFQWWSRFAGNHQSPSFRNTTLTMTAGTEIMAMLWAVDETTVVGIVRNFDDGEPPVGGMWTSPEIKLPDGSTQAPSISGATAAWVVERPSTPTAFEPFPNYGDVEFSECVAGSAPRAGEAIDAEQTLATRRLMRIFEVPAGGPSRTRVISHAERRSATSVSVRYGPFGG